MPQINRERERETSLPANKEKILCSETLYETALKQYFVKPVYFKKRFDINKQSVKHKTYLSQCTIQNLSHCPNNERSAITNMYRMKEIVHYVINCTW